MNNSLKHILSATAVATLIGSGAAIAAGGGGGGGGSAPSQSAPRYNAAQEYQNGIAALKSSNYKAAVKAFRRVVSVAPRNANGQYWLGVSYARSNDYRKAAKSFEKALKYNRTMVPARRDLAISYAKIGKSGKAQTHLDQLLKEQASCGECASKTQLSDAVTKVRAAMGSNQASLQFDPALPTTNANGGDRAYVAAVALINQQRYEDAIADLEQAANAFGPHPDILTYLGFANRKMKRFDVAEDYYRRALAVAPTHLGATEYYGELMVERGDLAGAKAKLARLDSLCSFGCHEAEELRRWIKEGEARRS